MSLAVSVHYTERIRCAVDVVGISNFNTFLKNTETYRRDLRRVEYGDERDPEMREFFERISPLNNAEKIRNPILIVQGSNDPRVPRTEAEQMKNVIKAHGGDVWYLEAKDEGHGFAKKGNADFQRYVTVMFVKRCLLDEG
jgi:dipeptidyl aminopeptidase/acylaminoacyl peptidase